MWLLAVLCVAVSGTSRRIGRLVGGGLESYERGLNTAGRAVLPAARAVARLLGRLLGPVARLSRRIDAPLLEAVRRSWDAVGLRLLRWLTRPAGRVVRRAVSC